MRKFLLLLLLVVALGVLVASARAWPTNVEIHFSNGREAIDCPDAPPGTIIDSLYIVGRFFSCCPVMVEYKVTYPGALTRLSDNTGGLDIGDSYAGIITSWPSPLDCLYECVLNKVIFLWMCQGCADTNIPIVVVPHPLWQCFRYKCLWPDDYIHCAIGMTSLICSTLPIEKTTWGQIKELYR